MIKTFEQYKKLTIAGDIYLKNKNFDLRNFNRMFFKEENSIIFFENIEREGVDDSYKIRATNYRIHSDDKYIDNFWISKKDNVMDFFDFFDLYEVLNSEELFENYPDHTTILYNYVTNEMNELEVHNRLQENETHAWYDKLELIKYQLDMTDVEQYIEAKKYNL